MDRYRILVIGAGFSVHAGLPLGDDLFALVRDLVNRRFGNDNKLEQDIAKYLKYRKRCFGINETDSIDYEKFMSHLDLEHHLGLRGNDTWSEDGNEGQLMIRNGIMQVIHSRMPDNLTPEVRAFCEGLSPTDTILTFNYDTLIERGLKELGRPYRLFPNRLKNIGCMYSTIDSEAERGEIVIHKLHGSIDWFSKIPYLKDRAFAEQSPCPWESLHPVFREGSKIAHSPLIEGPYEENDPLQHIYRIHDLNDLVGGEFWQFSPLILSPSSSKILYSDPIKGLWRGLQQIGGLNLGLGVVGYSLPEYDEYARQALYHLVRNYTEFEPDRELGNLRKTPVRILDYAPQGDSGWRIRKSYSFLNWDRCELKTTGLDTDGIKWLLR
ncbi:SIR2 family protein [Methylolobus aquaticus]